MIIVIEGIIEIIFLNHKLDNNNKDFKLNLKERKDHTQENHMNHHIAKEKSLQVDSMEEKNHQEYLKKKDNNN